MQKQFSSLEQETLEGLYEANSKKKKKCQQCYKVKMKKSGSMEV